MLENITETYALQYGCHSNRTSRHETRRELFEKLIRQADFCVTLYLSSITTDKRRFLWGSKDLGILFRAPVTQRDSLEIEHPNTTLRSKDTRKYLSKISTVLKNKNVVKRNFFFQSY